MQYKYITGSDRITANRANLTGFAIYATADAVVYIHDADWATNKAIPLSILAGQTAVATFPNGLSCNDGIYVEVSSGTIEGSIWWE